MVDNFKKTVIVNMENEKLIIGSISPECDHFLRTHPHLGIKIKIYVPSIANYMRSEDEMNKLRKTDPRFTNEQLDKIIGNSLPNYIIKINKDD